MDMTYDAVEARFQDAIKAMTAERSIVQLRDDFTYHWIASNLDSPVHRPSQNYEDFIVDFLHLIKARP